MAALVGEHAWRPFVQMDLAVQVPIEGSGCQRYLLSNHSRDLGDHQPEDLVRHEIVACPIEVRGVLQHLLLDMPVGARLEGLGHCVG